MTVEGRRRKARLRRLFESRKTRKLALGGMISLTGAGGAFVSRPPPAGPNHRRPYDDPVKEAVARTMVERLAGRGWDLPNLEHQRVDHYVNAFTDGMRSTLETFLIRSGRYLPMISIKLEEEDMPHDLIFLAMIESGFDPIARSAAQASGLWQFLAHTGRSFGLRVDAEVDERNHPERATAAALDYLRYLHDRFDSWYLAAAAYNAGEGRIARIMKEVTGSEKATSEEAYYKIWSRLPKETRDYVPKMIAAARIAKDPKAYGFDHLIPEEPQAVEEVEVKAGTSLAEVAKESKADVQELRKLNPHLKKGRVPSDGSYPVTVPIGAARAFASSGGVATGIVPTTPVQ